MGGLSKRWKNLTQVLLEEHGERAFVGPLAAKGILFCCQHKFILVTADAKVQGFSTVLVTVDHHFATNLVVN